MMTWITIGEITVNFGLGDAALVVLIALILTYKISN